MTIRTHTINKKNPQHKQEWSWEETPEFVDALLKLDVSSELLGRVDVPKRIHIPNKNFAPLKARIKK